MTLYGAVKKFCFNVSALYYIIPTVLWFTFIYACNKRNKENIPTILMCEHDSAISITLN